MKLVNPILKIIGLLKPLWEKMGINTLHLKAILRAKLIMDGRREISLHNQNKKNSNQLNVQVFVNAFFGLFLGMILLNNVDVEIRFLIYHSALLVFFTMLIISEFSTILFDTKDNTEILPRPVNSKTYYASKVIHIIIYLLILGIPLSLGGVIISAFKFGLFSALVLFVLILFDILLAVFLSNVFYMAIIKFFSSKKIKDVVLYVQVFLGIAVYGGYQIMPKIFNSNLIAGAKLGNHWWLYLIPPVWSAKISALFSIGHFTELIPALILNICFPLIGLYAIVKFFAPLYNQKLSQIDNADTVKTINQKRLKTRRYFVLNLLPLSAQVKAVYKLISKVISNDRKFKQGTFSMIGYFVVLLLVPLISDFHNPAQMIESLGASKKFFMLLFLPVFLSLMINTGIQYSDQNEAVWLFQFLPIKRPGEIILSGFMVTLLRFFLPFTLITNAIVVAIWPTIIYHNIILSWALSLVFLVLTILISDKYLPLSRLRNMQNSSRNFTKVLSNFLSIIVMGGIAFGCTFLPNWVVYIISAILFLTFLLLIRKIREIQWQKIM